MRIVPPLIVLLLVAVFVSQAEVVTQEPKIDDSSESTPISDTVFRTEWEIFLEALIYTESRGDSQAVGRTDDVGILQITPVYVREVNRILREERYTLEDRRDSLKSLEMFHVVQDYWNPERDIARAIRLHNPGAGPWYAERIHARMNTIREKI